MNEQELEILTKRIMRTVARPRDQERIISDIKELAEDMSKDIVHFWFTKADGSERSAYGTRAPDIIREYGAEPKDGPEQDSPRESFPYFDLHRRAWRCFVPERLIKIDRNYTI